MIARTAIILLSVLSMSVSALAESAFAPLGVGIPLENGSAYSASISRADLVHSDSVYFSIDNPATWRSYGLTKYTTSFGASKVFGSDVTGEDISDNYVFPNAAILLPIYKTLGLGFYYQSLTDHDYLLYGSDTYDIGEPVDTLDSYDILRRVQGNGGLGRAGGRLAFQFTRVLSIGFGIDYYFGELEELSTLDFEQGVFQRSGRFIRHELSGIGTSVGLNARLNDRLAFGVMVKPPATLDISSSVTIQGGDSTGLEMENFEFPFSIGGGIEYNAGRYRALASTSYEAWKDSNNPFGDRAEYGNSMDVGIGFERLGLKEPLIPWYEFITFRAGAGIHQYYVNAGGNPLNSYRASGGLGIPVAGGRGMLDVALTYEYRGTVNDNQAHESIYGIRLGISSTERWFVRRAR